MATARPELLPRIPRWLLIVGAGLAIAGFASVGMRLAPAPYAFSAAAVLLVLVSSVIDPRIGLAALTFAMVFSPELGSVVYVRAEDVILGVVVLGWLARQAVLREPLRDNPMLAPMLALAAAGLAAMLLALAAGNVDPFTGQHVPIAISALHWIKRLEYFAIVFLVAQSLRSRSEAGVFTALLLLAAVLVAAGGTARIAAHTGDPHFRLDAPFDTGEANTLGEYLMFAIALALGLLLSGPSRFRLLLLAGLAIGAVAFAYTFSRGSYIALIVVVLLAALIKDARLLLVVAALAFALPAHLPGNVVARVGSIPHEISTADTSDVGSNAFLARTDSYRVAALRVAERPLLGYGPGVVALARIESQYAKEAVDGGLVGLGLFLWLLGRVVRLGADVWRRGRVALDRGIGLGFVCGAVGMAVAGLGAIPFTTIRTMEAFSFAAGIVVVLWRLQLEESPEESAA